PDSKIRHLYLSLPMEGLFGEIRPGMDTAVIAEGIFDGLAQERAIEAVNAAGDGKPKLKWASLAAYGTNGFKEAYIADLKAAGIKNILLTMDGDAPGLASNLKLAKMLEPHFAVR